MKPYLLILGSLLVASGCATTRLITPENAMKSRIEIDYVLGHSNYKYIALGGKEEAEISSFRDDKVLEKKSIPASGLEVLRQVKDQGLSVPFLLFTGEAFSNIPHISYLNFSYIEKAEPKKLKAEVVRQLQLIRGAS